MKKTITIKFKIMKTTRLIRYILYSAVLVAFGLVGCEEVDIYSIDADMCTDCGACADVCPTESIHPA